MEKVKIYLMAFESDTRVEEMLATVNEPEVEDFVEANVDAPSPLPALTYKSMVIQTKTPEGDITIDTQQCEQFESIKRLLVEGPKDLVVKMIDRAWAKTCEEKGVPLTPTPYSW